MCAIASACANQFKCAINRLCRLILSTLYGKCEKTRRFKR